MVRRVADESGGEFEPQLVDISAELDFYTKLSLTSQPLMEVAEQPGSSLLSVHDSAEEVRARARARGVSLDLAQDCLLTTPRLRLPLAIARASSSPPLCR
jgi:hypothetical protein